MLPAHLLERRHRMIVAVLAAHFPGLLAVRPGRAATRLGHSLFDTARSSRSPSSPIPRVELRWRTISACTGLVTCSVALVHLWDGVIESHFIFFVMVGVVSLYQDWVPVPASPSSSSSLHHGVVGALYPHAVFSHAAGRTRGSGRASTAASSSPRASPTSPPGGSTRTRC